MSKPIFDLWENPVLYLRKKALQDRASARRRRFALPKGRRLPDAVFPAHPWRKGGVTHLRELIKASIAADKD